MPRSSVKSARPGKASQASEGLVQLERDLLMHLARCPTSESALKVVLKVACGLEGVDGGGIYRYDADHHFLSLVADEGLPKAFVREVTHYDSKRQEMKLVLKGKNIYLTPDEDSSVSEFMRRWKVHQLAVLPVFYAGRLLGVLNLATLRHQAFSPSVQLAMETLCRHAGLVIDRIENDHARRESEERYRELVDVLPDGVVVHVAGKLVYANAEAARICGVASPADMIGREANSFIVPEDRQAARERVGWLIAEGGRITRAKASLLQPSGVRVPCALSGTRISYKGQPAVQTLLHDLSVEKEADDKLRASEIRFRPVLDAVAEGILIVSADGTLAYANAAARILLGSARRLSEVPVVAPWTRHAKAAREGRQPMVEVDTILFSGKPREIESSWVPVLDADGGLEGVSCVYRDVTERNRLALERRLLAQSLLEVQEQERKNVSDFLHDHMGPLMIMAKMELEQLARGVPAKLQPKLKAVGSRLDEALRGIRHRALAVRPPLIDDLDVQDALEFLVEEFCRNHGAAVKLAPVPRIPSLGSAYKTCLYRVLEEALQNVACHAKATTTTVTVEEHEQAVVMIIQDDGVGFDVASVLPGKRLGLIGMREIVASLGGQLVLHSKLGEGTLVQVTVPVQEQGEGGGR